MKKHLLIVLFSMISLGSRPVFCMQEPGEFHGPRPSFIQCVLFFAGLKIAYNLYDSNKENIQSALVFGVTTLLLIPAGRIR